MTNDTRESPFSLSIPDCKVDTFLVGGAGGQ